MDVKTSFLHGDLEEEIYMKKPKGFVVKGKKELVCKLKKSLYGLKQSPRMWYQKFDTYILRLGFVRSRDDQCVYSKQVSNHFIYVVLYVDDMLLVGDNMDVLTGEIDRPSTGRVEPVRGCLNNPSRLEWTTLTSLTAPLAALRSPKKAKEKS
jgi:hypothetical protein